MSWLLSLCVQKPPAAVTDVSSMSGVHVNHRTGTSGTRLPHHHQATWHVPGPGDTCLGTRRMCGAGGDWTGLGSTLFCCVRSWFICCWPAWCGWHSASAALASAGRTNIKHMAGPSLHPFITRLATMLDQWTSVHQPRYLDVTVASPCLFIFIQLAWTHHSTTATTTASQADKKLTKMS